MSEAPPPPAAVPRPSGPAVQRRNPERETVQSAAGRKLTPSKHLEAALAEAEKHPLDDRACRVVVASSRMHLIFDLPFEHVEALLDAAVERGVETSRAVAAQTLALVASGADVGNNWIVAVAALAYFDREYLRSGARGWNTLALQVEVLGTQITATRCSYAIEYPSGIIDLGADPLGLKRRG